MKEERHGRYVKDVRVLIYYNDFPNEMREVKGDPKKGEFCFTGDVVYFHPDDQKVLKRIYYDSVQPVVRMAHRRSGVKVRIKP